MCGFVVHICGDGGAEARYPALRSATRLIQHRGPDDEAFYRSTWLSAGFRRLKIVDLSDAGRQPMSDDSGRYWIVFNGEIYNDRVLREQLRSAGWTFRSTSDTEVLLKAFLEWGEDCLARFNGMFAFLIWDQEEQTVFGARDRFGEKPLFYAHDGSSTYFASEIKALFPLLRDVPPFRPALVRDYLQDGRLDFCPSSFFEGIEQIPAAHKFTWKRDRFAIQRYWQLEEKEPVHVANPAEEFRELFLDAVRLRTRSDVPVGTCLSGGLDSGSIVCSLATMRDSGDRVVTGKTFTAHYDQFDEATLVKVVNERSGSTGYTITPCPASLEDLEELLWYHDEPVHSFTAFAGREVMQLARHQGVVVLLNGQGADEVLGGYPKFIKPYVFQLLRFGRWWSAVDAAAGSRELTKCGALQTICSSLKAGLKTTLAGSTRLNDRSRTRRRRHADHVCCMRADFLSVAESDAMGLPVSGFADLFKRRLHESQIGLHLPFLLRLEDRNSMSHSIESRLPFLDHRIAEFAFSLPTLTLMQHGRNKYLLREAMRGVLPEEILTRSSKFGFPVPHSEWIYDRFRDQVQDILTAPSEITRNLFRLDDLRKRYMRDATDRNNDAAGFWFRVTCLEVLLRVLAKHQVTETDGPITGVSALQVNGPSRDMPA